MMRKKNIINGPRYKLIYKTLREKILKGEFGDGNMIPSENTLARMNSVSRVTVRSAIEALKRDGLLDTVPGLGHRVANPVVRIDEPLKPILFIGRRDGITPIIFESIQRQACENEIECRMMSYSNRFDSDVLELDDSFLSGIQPYEISGIVFFSDKQPCHELVSFVKEMNIPLVCVGYSYSGVFDSVLSDNYGAARLLAENLLSRGHRKIIYASDEYLEKNVESFKLRREGLFVAFGSDNTRFKAQNFLYDNPQYEVNKPVVAEFLKALSEGTRSVVASNAYLAHRLREIITANGFQIPRDISLATFISDDNYFRENNKLKKICGMVENWHEIGKISFETLISKIKNNNQLPRTIMVPMSFEEGDTISSPDSEQEFSKKRASFSETGSDSRSHSLKSCQLGQSVNDVNAVNKVKKNPSIPNLNLKKGENKMRITKFK